MHSDPRQLTRAEYDCRRRRTRFTLAIVFTVVGLGIVAGVVLPSVYRAHEDAQASSAPSVAASRAPSTLSSTQINGPWSISAGSTAGYRVHEVLNGQPVTVTGRTEQVSGSATIEQDAITAATVRVQVASIHTDSGARDSYFRDSVLDTQAFPTATFTLTSAIPNAVPTDGRTATWRATGRLTLHGVTRAVSATIQSGLAGDGAEISGSIPIRFRDYGVVPPSLGFVAVQDHGSVEFQLDARPSR